MVRGYNNKLLTILKNDISTVYYKDSDWFLIIYISHPFESFISIIEDTSRKGEVKKILSDASPEKSLF